MSGSHPGVWATRPRWAQVRTAAAASGLLLGLRWTMVRGAGARGRVVAGAALYLGLLATAAGLGPIVALLAGAPTAPTDAASRWAQATVQAAGEGRLGAVAAAVVGSVIVAGLSGPVVGSTHSALLPAADLAGVRPARLHRWFDGVATSATSVVGLLQLVALIAVSSLLWLTSADRSLWSLPLALWVAGTAWVALLMLTVAAGWIAERWQVAGARARMTVVAGVAGTAGLAAWVDPHHGRTSFGLGPAFADAVGAASEADLSAVALATLGLAGVALAAAVAGLWLCQAVVSRPSPGARRILGGPTRAGRQPGRLPVRPWPALAVLVVRTLGRTAQVRRPLLAATGIGMVSAWVTPTTPTAPTAVVVIVPLAVALAVGCNVFGLLGSALPWLVAQPGTASRLFTVAVAVQVLGALVVSALCWLPAVLAGRVEGDLAAPILAGTLTTVALIGRSALARAVRHPHQVRLGGRGDLLVPPLRAVGYTARFLLWGGQIGVLVMAMPVCWLPAAVGLVVLWCAWRVLRLRRWWADRSHQAHVLAVAGGA